MTTVKARSDMRILFVLIMVFASTESATSKTLKQTRLVERPSAYSVDSCSECTLSQHFLGFTAPADLRLRDGSLIHNVVSLKRIVVAEFGIDGEKLLVYLLINGQCTKDTVDFAQVVGLQRQGLGPGGATVLTKIYPARELFKSGTLNLAKLDYVELFGMVTYAGTESSPRAVGINKPFFGGGAYLSPFGFLLGGNVLPGLGVEALFENSRLRIPLFGALRWVFSGRAEERSISHFLPSPCSFRKRDTSQKLNLDAFQPTDGQTAHDFEEKPFADTRDSVTFFTREHVVDSDGPPLYLFAEGGTILNGKFDGAGKDPSVNSEEYSQWLVGGGIGTVFFDYLSVSLGYRFMRLNLRTPCPSCPPSATGNPDNFFFQNTNELHSVQLKIGARLSW